MPRAKKVKIDGIQFDSIAESEYYLILKSRQQAGEISNLRDHPRYDLIESFKRRNRKVAGMSYTPDFSYIEDGVQHVVEVKGYARPDYLIRRKLFLYFYGEDIIFHEAKKKGKEFKVRTW